jgi:TonB-linked SusC/RagA family outer membrane protein
MKEVRMKFYPGVSAAWALSKETFWEPVQTYVNTLKIRTSYGKLGDMNFTSSYYPFYPSLATTVPTGSNYLFSSGRQAYASSPPINNQNLTWITTGTIDFGVDMAFLNNRLNVSFDWYRRYADDFVGPADPLPSLLGTAVPQINNSAIETKGIELTIRWDDHILNNELHYSANFVLSDYKGVVKRYPNPTGLFDTWYNGRVMGDIWGFDSYGLFQSEEEVAAAPSQSKINASRWTPGDVRYVDQNGDGEIYWGDRTLDNPGDAVVVGNSTPRFSYGLSLAADYKGFDFSIFIHGIGKRDSWINNNYYWGCWGSSYWTWSPNVQQHDRWTPDNPNGFFPKFYLSEQNGKNQQCQPRYLQNAAFMRIKNLQVGYSLPANLTQKINFRKARIYVSVENLGTITKMFKTVDPEFAETAGQVYPLQRTWSCGLNVTF